ncbi:MAG TPA: 3-hydroxyacyl-ACP dehydratase FabZ family protein [Gemmataceae bacterium]|nr:3-hydroxyacyl-ACP dehydratase FabZ family protein [Gemmataceae bacterium]
MPPVLNFDPSQLDLTRVVADQEAIRGVLPQRFEMLQLNAVVHVDTDRELIAGYKDVRPDEFWVRGHMPGAPLLPGVLMCEAAAQLASFYIVKYSGLLDGRGFIGFGGMENVRFRAPVRPGDRLVMVAKGLKLRRRQSVFNIQGFVGTTMAFHVDVIGVPMTAAQVTESALAEEA